MLKHTFIQKGFVKELTLDQGHKSFIKLFDLDRWLKKKLIYFGIGVVDPCCVDPTTASYHDTVDANTAISIDTKITYIATTAARAYTLADGVDLQEKIIKMTVDGGDGVVTVAHLAGGTTITFNDAGDTVKLQFVGGAWHPLYNLGAVIA